MATTQVKHGGGKKIGRDKIKCQNYRAAKTMERNKAKRILRSNGAEACAKYCQEHDIRVPVKKGQ
jgi:RNase P protein component